MKRVMNFYRKKWIGVILCGKKPDKNHKLSPAFSNDDELVLQS